MRLKTWDNDFSKKRPKSIMFTEQCINTDMRDKSS